MDNIILSDNVQNQQICAECLNYLSVGPVMVSCDGKMICGRCSKSIRPDVKVLECSLYNLVAEKLVFKCINYYAGCEELLLFNEALEHEKICHKRRFKCPFCDYDGNGCQLVHHFNKKHRKYVVKEGYFNVNIENQFSRNLVFIKNSKIFCLTLFVGDAFVSISNLLVTPANLGPKQFKLRFFRSESNVEFVTPPIQVVQSIGCNAIEYQIKESFLLDQTSLLECFSSGWCLCTVEFIEADVEEKILRSNYLKKIGNSTDLPPSNVPEISVDKKVFNITCVLKMPPSALRTFINTELYLLQNCVNCKSYITTVFLCPKYHMACKKCSATPCSVCKSFCTWNNRSEIHDILLACEWDGCFKRTNIFNYTIHKQVCKFRKYQCPDVKCRFVGCFGCLRGHWHLSPLICQEILSFGHRDRAVFWFLPRCREIFYVVIEYNPVSKESFVIVHEVNAVVSRRYDLSIQGWRQIRACGLEFGMWPDGTVYDRFSKDSRGTVRYLSVKTPKTYRSGAFMICHMIS